jgi:hypothetical protein
VFTLKQQQAKRTISSDNARSIPMRIDGYFKLEAGTGFILLVETETIGYVTTKMFFLLI